jgi:hypothetical protein
VNDKYGQRILPIWLPMAMAQNPHARLDLDQSLFWNGQNNPAREKKAGERLQVAPAQRAPGNKDMRLDLRSPHKLILNGNVTQAGWGANICRFLSMSAKSAIINSKLWYLAAIKLNAPNATARSWRHSFQSLQ